MRHLLVCAVLLLVPEIAPAAYPCESGRPWTCFGSIEASFHLDGQTGTIGMEIFDNGDLLASATPGAKLLALGPPPTRSFYKGLPDAKISEGYAFAFFDYGFAYPLQALEQSYPGGSVPEKEVETHVLLESIEAKLVANTVSKDKVQYRLSTKSGEMVGFVDFSKKPALPDSFPFGEWKDRTLKSYATLGEARSARP